ncbi:Tim44-like domain containing protein [Sporothrix schenckii 1099-18]|uniref:Mitochondrial import inner membrane translocase subunit TIM44 n=1 Tax=Sporothrix schenckii 1099-18 TaxID=1397361 RepID=A0A0F2LZ02_SPOSC|nr:Tim44-like domain containing protein [Sporothrix schenckii 1099-18]KJR81735.1 Tim44-like domain containing protein [Sporothrix schenckii 1099-18]
MNVARQAHPGALSRASSSLLTTGRTPAYRRLLTSPSLLRSQDAASRTPLSSTPSTFSSSSSALTSPFLPTSIRLAMPTQARAFHATVLRSQQQPPSEEQSKKAEAQAGAKEGAAAEEQQKTEKEAKDGQEGEGKEGEGKGGEGEDGKAKEDNEAAPPPPPHGDKTPWQVFLETMQSEFKQSKEWNDSTKALAEGAHQFTESESVQRARKAYEATSGAVSSTASTVIKSTATTIGKGAAWTWETPVMKGVRAGANATGEVLDKATKPIRETEAYKNVKDVIDDGSSSRYGGWADKEERRQRREKWRAAQGANGAPEVFEENPDAGTNVTVHKDAAWKEAWRGFKDSNKVVQGFFSMKDVYNESENPLISTARSITDRVAGFFAENETAMVIKKLRQMDPAFQLEPFLRELREYILPEVLDAYVKGDVETLKLWLSEAQYSVYEALTKQYLTAGLKSDGRILDIRHVDILKARMLEPGEIPVFIITCRTQEVHVYRQVKTDELAAGMEDKVQLVTYAIGITRVPEDVSNPETRGWRLIEMQKSGRDYI